MTLTDQLLSRDAIAPPLEWQPDPRIAAAQAEADTPEARQARDQAWTSIYLEHSPDLNNYAASICRDPYAAEDVVQLAFERAFKKIGDFTETKPTSLKSWFVRIIHNLAVDYIRSSGRHITSVAPEILEGSTKPRVNSPPQEQADPFARLAIKETLEELKEELPPKQHTALLASAFGFSTEENAVLHNTTPAGIYTKIYRGKMVARKVIKRAA